MNTALLVLGFIAVMVFVNVAVVLFIRRATMMPAIEEDDADALMAFAYSPEWNSDLFGA